MPAELRRRAATNRPETWATLDATRAAFERGTNGADGVGFATGEGIVGSDVDGCRDDLGELTPDAAAIIAQVYTYAEVSPSGTGVRFWATTDADPAKRRGAVELDPWGQYLTVAGHQLDGTGR